MSNKGLVINKMESLKSEKNVIQIKDLQELPAEKFRELREQICTSLQGRRSNCSMSFNFSVEDVTANDSLGIELHDENSVIYVPAAEEEAEAQIQELNDEDGEETIVAPPSPEDDNRNASVLQGERSKSLKRKASSSHALERAPVEKIARTSFAGVLNVTEETHKIEVICSTPTMTTASAKHSVDLDAVELSPICTDNQAGAPCGMNAGCACASKMADACEQIKKIVGDVHQLLGADGPLSNLRKLMNLGEAFEQYQRDGAAMSECNITTMMVLPPKSSPLDLEIDTAGVKIYNNADTFITDNIHYQSDHRHRGLKPIVIDGSNIAMAHGQDRRYSVRGLRICIDFFLRRGHRVYAFIPAYRLRRDGSDDQRSLHELVRRGLVFCTPSWEAGGRRYCSYDDRIMLQAAAAMNAVVVSRDHFRDLQEEDARFARLLQRGLLMPTFVGDMLIFPQDPLGRRGPTLARFLRYP